MSSLKDTATGHNLTASKYNFTTDMNCVLDSAISLDVNHLIRTALISISNSFSFQIWFKINSYISRLSLFSYDFFHMFSYDSFRNLIGFADESRLFFISINKNSRDKILVIYSFNTLILQIAKWYQINYVYDNGQNFLYLNGILIASRFAFIHQKITTNLVFGNGPNIALSQAKLISGAFSQQTVLNSYVASFDGNFFKYLVYYN